MAADQVTARLDSVLAAMERMEQSLQLTRNSLESKIDSVAIDLTHLREDHRKLADRTKTLEGTIEELGPNVTQTDKQLDAITEYLSDIQLPVLTAAQQNDLGAPLDSEELRDTIFNLSNGKSPRPDGLPAEFYKAASDILIPHLAKISDGQKKGHYTIHLKLGRQCKALPPTASTPFGLHRKLAINPSSSGFVNARLAVSFTLNEADHDNGKDSGRKSHSEMSRSFQDGLMTSLPGLWSREPSTPEVKKTRHTSLPPIHTEKDEDGKPMQGLGFGYLPQGSRSEPNISKAFMALDSVKDIHQQIEQRLRKSDLKAIKKTEHFLPANLLSPRSSRYPLWEDAKVNKKCDVRIPSILSPPDFPKQSKNTYSLLPRLSTTADKKEEMNSRKLSAKTAPSFSEDLSTSTNSITSSTEYCSKSLKGLRQKTKHRDLLIDSEDEFVFDSDTEGVDEEDQLLISSENIAETANILSEPVNIKSNQHQGSSVEIEITKIDLQVSNNIAIGQDEDFHENQLSNADENDITTGTVDTTTEKRELTHKQEIFETNTAVLEAAVEETRYPGITVAPADEKPLERRVCFMPESTANKDVEEIKETEPCPVVHITVSEYDPLSECTLKSSKREHVKRKSINGSIPSNSEQNLKKLSDKDSEKRKLKKRNAKSPLIKTKTSAKKQQERINSKITLTTQNRKLQAVSKQINMRGLDFLSPGFAETVIKSKTKTPQTLPNNLRKNAHKSVENGRIAESKRVSSSTRSVHLSVLGSQPNSHFGNMKYSDMFVEIVSPGSGPEICEMFGTPMYSNARDQSNKEERFSRDGISAPPRNSITSHGLRSADTNVNRRLKSTKKRARSSTKSNTSQTKENIKSEVPKPKGFLLTESDNEQEDNVIISGTNWQITPSRSNICFPDDEIQHAAKTSQLIREVQLNSHLDLPTIQESTLENISRSREKFDQNQTNRSGLLSLHLDDDNVDFSKSQHMNLENKKTSISESDQETSNSDKCKTIFDVDSLDAAGSENRTSHIKNNKITETFLDDHKETFSNMAEKYDSARSPTHRTPNEQITHSANSFSKPYSEIINCASSEELTDELLSCLAAKMLSIDAKDFTSFRANTENNITEKQSCAYEQEASNLTGHNKDIIGIEEIEESHSLNDDSTFSNYSSVNDDSIMWTKGDVLGKGAYGTVYCGLTSHGQLIAAKQVPLNTSDTDTTEKEYQKLQEEVDLLRTLNHVNIVGFLGTCLQDNIVSIFMEFIPGGSISSILKRFGPLPEIVFSRYTRQILQGVSYLHENKVIHRDIKGNNIMLMQTGVIKLIDFGCAKRLACLSLNGTHFEMLKSMHGTPYWMAPEVINASGYGTKSDIWSTGCTVFEMATGKPPLAHMDRLPAMFYIGAQRGKMPSLSNHFSEKAREFVDLCLIRNQSERPSALQLLRHPFIKPKQKLSSWTKIDRPKLP
ncbi:mitogen-activated protein kinase kinase kinase 19 [Lissotriton helveticus]